MSGPLAGVKVIDITQGLAGPYATMQLGDAGAAVTKIEPLTGDYARGYGPPFIGDQGAQFLGLNRNKRSLALDITAPAGRDVLLRLVRDADVFVSDLLPEETERLGLSHEALAAHNPRLITCAVTPFGDRGPMANQPAAELVVQAMADYTNSLGAIGAPPVRLGTDVANVNTGQMAVQAIVAALFQRHRTGVGQRVTVSLFGSLLHMRGMIWACQSEGVDDWWGFHQDTYIKPPDSGYATRDGHVYLSMFGPTDDSYARLLDTLGLSDRTADPRWHNNGRDALGGPSRYGWEVKDAWEEKTRDLTSAEAIDLFKRHGAVAVPMHDYESLTAHPQVAEIGMVQQVESPTLGTLTMTGIPWAFSETPGSIESPPPLLGEHSEAVLVAAGYTPDEVEGLRARGVVG